MLPSAFELIFDLDDTLLDSFNGYSQTHQRVARELGWPVLTLDDLVAYDKDFPTTLRRQYPGREPDVFIDAWARVMDEYPYGPIAEVPATLATLRARGHRLWMVTSRSRKNLALRFHQAGIEEHWFEGVFTADEQPAQKPDPRCFEPVWAQLGRRPGHPELGPTVYIGDRAGDRQAAAAAGIHFVAVLTGPEVRRGFPGDIDRRFVLEDATHVVRWLDEHGESLQQHARAAEVAAS